MTGSGMRITFENGLQIDSGGGLDTTLRDVIDGTQVASALKLSTLAAYVNGDLTVTGDVDMADFLDQIFYTAMDGQDTATVDSLAYRIAEIERHLHHSEQWFGKSAGDTYLDRDSLTSWQLTAGLAEAYGTEVQISNGDEIESGDADKRFDPHRFQITAVGTANQLYKFQIWTGTGAFGAATLATEFTYIAASNQISEGPLDVSSVRRPCNHKIWARVKCQTNSATIDFLIGVHTYDG